VVVVYLKNGEKAPMPDADFVKLEAFADSRGLMLRCLFGSQEVGQFKWDDVAGYTVAATPSVGVSPGEAYEAWGQQRSPI
jgi:hypothetical protein